MPAALRRFKADLFKALAHPARIQILEVLRQGEQTVSQLQAALEIDPSSVSQHLAVLRARDLLEPRKAGTSVYYRVLDAQLFSILDAARQIFAAHVQDLQDVLEAEQIEDGARAGGSPAGRPLSQSGLVAVTQSQLRGMNRPAASLRPGYVASQSGSPKMSRTAPASARTESSTE
jgi:DNA-binding transcriptional ArsR family regulator